LLKAAFRRSLHRLSPYRYAQRYGTALTLRAPGGANGTVLLSYMLLPFRAGRRDKVSRQHANFLRAWDMVAILHGLGFDVDVIDASNRQFVPRRRYSAVIGNTDCLDRLAPFLDAACRKVHYATEAYVDARNGPAGELGRVRELERRTGRDYTPKRLVSNPELVRRSIAKADAVIIGGGRETVATFPDDVRRKAFVCTMPLYPETLPHVPLPDRRGSEFLWFFGQGLVHKGLDLVVEAFLERPRLRLNIAGRMEPDFDAIYGAAIRRSANISFHGFLDTGGPVFADLLARCRCFVAPSVNEGISPAVVTLLQLGLFPIVSRGTGVDLPEGLGIVLESCTTESIGRAVDEAAAMSDAELNGRCVALSRFARHTYTPDAFRQQFAAAMRSILFVE
jgi:hypothetical protein